MLLCNEAELQALLLVPATWRTELLCKFSEVTALRYTANVDNWKLVFFLAVPLFCVVFFEQRKEAGLSGGVYEV